MLTHCEQKIMELLLPQPFRFYSIKKISSLIDTSYALTYDSVRSLQKKEIIKAEKMGNVLACNLNLSANPQLLAVSSLILSENFLNKVSFGFVIDEIRGKLSDSIYILALFGSYAKGRATKKSDVDLLFIVQNKLDIDKIKKRIQSVLSETNMKIEFEVITSEWLIKMFEEKQTVGREVLNASIILHGSEQYYTMVNNYDKKRGH